MKKKSNPRNLKVAGKFSETLENELNLKHRATVEYAESPEIAVYAAGFPTRWILREKSEIRYRIESIKLTMKEWLKNYFDACRGSIIWNDEDQLFSIKLIIEKKGCDL